MVPPASPSAAPYGAGARMWMSAGLVPVGRPSARAPEGQDASRTAVSHPHVISFTRGQAYAACGADLVLERHKLERPAAAKGPEEDRPPERPARAQDARRTRVIIIISAAGGARPSPHRGHIEDIMQARRTSRRTSKAKTSPASSSRAQTSSSARRTRASPCRPAGASSPP